MVKKLLYFVVFPLLTLLSAVAAMGVWGLPVDRFRPAVTAEMRRLTGMDCRIDKLKMSFTELRALGVAFASGTAKGGPFCTVGTARISLDWNLLKDLWHGNALVIQEFDIEKVYFHLDSLVAALDAAAPAPRRAENAPAPNPPVTAADLARPAETAESNAPVLRVARFRVRDARLLMHGVEMKITEAAGGRAPEGLNFTANAAIDSGRLSCRGILQLFPRDGLLQARQAEASFTLNSLPLTVFYRLFPDSFDFLKRRGIADGNLDVSYNWQKDGGLGFSGSVKTRDTIAYLFDQDVPVPASVWDFAGSYADEKLTIDKFALKGDVDDFHLDGYADFRKDSQVYKISSSGLSFPLICHAAGNRELSGQMRGLVRFTGFIAVDRDELDIKGEGGTAGLEPCYAPLNLAKKIVGKGEFRYKSRDRIIRLDNMNFDYGFGRASGSLHFPWLKKLEAGDFASDLSLECELEPLSRLVGIELAGRVNGKVAVSSANAREMKYQVDLQGIKEVNAKFGGGEVLDVGKFSFALAGSSFWREKRHVLEKIQIASTPLQGTLTGGYAAGRTDLAYDLRLEPRTLWPFWVHAVKGKVNAAAFGAVALKGRLSMDTENVCRFDRTDCRGMLVRGAGQKPWYYSLMFSGSADCREKGKIALRDGDWRLHDAKNTLAVMSFNADAVEDGSQITGEALLRTRLPVARELQRLLDLPAFFPALQGGALAARARMVWRDSAPTEYRLALNLTEARTSDMMQKQQIAMQGVLEDRTRVDGSLRLRDWRFRTADHSLDVTGNGRVFALEHPQVDLSLNAHSNVEKTLQALNIRPPYKISGMVDSEVLIKGAMDKPEFTVSGRAADIVIDDGEQVRKLRSPRMEGTFSCVCDRQTGDIGAFKIPRGQLRTADWMLRFSAQADRLRYVPAGGADGVPTLSFGKGMACNYRLSGRRTFLTWLQPLLEGLVGGAPDTSESFSSRGTLRAKEIPLRATGDYRLLRGLQIADGLTTLDHLQAGRLSLRNLMLPYRLANGVLAAENGRCVSGGDVDMNLRADFTAAVPQGKMEIAATKLDLSQVLGSLTPDTRITSGWAFIPATGKGKYLNLAWRGTSLEEILNSLTVPEVSLSMENVTVRTVSQPVNWEEVLKYDFHQSVAREIASHLTKISAANAGKPLDLRLREVVIAGKLADRCLTLEPCVVTGGNTADARAVGRVHFNRALALRLWPLGNLERHIDLDALKSNGMVRDFLNSLPAARRAEAERLIPDWLNALAAKKKLYIDIKGTLDNPEADFRGIRDGVKAELPDLLGKIAALVGQSSLIGDIFGKDALKNAGKDGKPLINLDDLLR